MRGIPDHTPFLWSVSLSPLLYSKASWSWQAGTAHLLPLCQEAATSCLL